jgi:hypothetical protein
MMNRGDALVGIKRSGNQLEIARLVRFGGNDECRTFLTFGGKTWWWMLAARGLG